MSSDTSSRSTRFPIASVSVDSNAVEWVVNGGAVLPKEWTMRTRLGSSAPTAELAVNASRSSPTDTLPRVFMATQGLSNARGLWHSLPVSSREGLLLGLEEDVKLAFARLCSPLQHPYFSRVTRSASRWPLSRIVDGREPGRRSTRWVVHRRHARGRDPRPSGVHVGRLYLDRLPS